MKNLVIYDNTGIIYIIMGGCYTVPQGGIQYLEIEVPTGKYITSVDTSVTPNVAVLEDVPKTEQEIANERIAEQETALVELASLVGGNN